MRLSKKLDRYIEREIIKQTEFSEENILKRFVFEEDKSIKRVKTLKVLIPILYSLVLMLITSVVSISIYDHVKDKQYGENQIIMDALEAFDNELDDTYLKQHLFQIDYYLVIGTYYSFELNEQMLMVYNKKDKDIEVSISLNNQTYLCDSKVEIFEVDLLENNILICYKNGIEYYSTTFSKNVA